MATDELWNDVCTHEAKGEVSQATEIKKEDNQLLMSTEKNLFPLEKLKLPLDATKEKKKPGRRTNFSPEDDAQLAQLVKLHGDTKWSLIASIMKKWNRKQLREHYINFIKCKNTSTNFTPIEDSLILMHVKEFGHTWKDLVNKLPDRSPIAIKNRYYKVLMKRINAPCELNVETKGRNSSQRVSTRNGSTNDRISGDKSNVDEQVQVLIAQEEKLINGIKLIEERIEKLAVNIKE